MSARMVIAAVLAGIVCFMWSAISHMALGLGEVSIRNIPDEGPVLSAMSSSIPASGLYLFPGMPPGSKGTPEERRVANQQWEEAYRTQPHGLLVFHPPGKPFAMGRRLVAELLANIAGALVAAWLLAQAATTAFFPRVMFVALLALFASLSIDASYWIWYGFPTGFTLASAADQVVGWGLSGLVLAGMIRPKSR